MSTDLDTIVARYDERRMAMAREAEQAREVEEIYDGDYAVAVPELAKNERAAIPNLVKQAIDQHGMRIASTVANLTSDPVKANSKRSEQRARDRKQAVSGWLEFSEHKIKLRRRARWLITYATSPVVVRPDFKLGIPHWHLRKPLFTFPAPTADPDDMCPDDVIFDFTRTLGWLEDTYGAETVGQIKRDRNATKDTPFTVIEYIDGDEIVMAVVSSGESRVGWHEADYGRSKIYVPGGGRWAGTRDVVELERFPNRAGVCTAVVPGSISLDRPQGQFHQMVGLFQNQALLMALELNAVFRGVYPDTWLVGRGDEIPQIITKADGLKGQVGRVTNGDIKSMNENPGYQTYPTLNYLERAQRQNGLIPAEYGGESSTNVRTGRRGDAILSAVVDFPTQEAQEILARSLKHEITRGIAVAKGHFGSRKTSFHVSWRGAKGPVTYTPNETFEDDGETLNVSYAYPGTDLNGQTIRVGQKLGLGLISQQTAREQDPEIEDAELEHDRSVAESLERAMLTGLEQQAAAGAIPPTDIARIRYLVRTDRMDLDEAVAKVQQEAQERQASTVEPVAPGSPEAQPGIAQPGAGAEAGIVEPQDDVADLRQVLGNLRLGQRATPAETAAGQMAAIS